MTAGGRPPHEITGLLQAVHDLERVDPWCRNAVTNQGPTPS
jgi:hypothetical protein